MTVYLTEHQQAITELATNPRFKSVFIKCLEEEELLGNFERLCGVKRPTQRLIPVERMVDEATGFRQAQWNEFLSEFVLFVYRCVWLVWTERNNPECWR